MEAFVTHRGKVALLDRANVDTDQIIPKQFLKSIRRTGFGRSLFFDWRYREDGSDNPDFELNHPRYRGSSLLVTRNNFGCGSSREHAVWAVMQYGFRVIIAPRVRRGEDEIPGFADIFRNNSAKNGLLTIELAEDDVQALFEAVEAQEGLEATVDLESMTLTLHARDGNRLFSFDLDHGVRESLLNGLDPISLTLQYEDDISQFERSHDTQRAG
jgi:3-isopropylmalate/(R)-2-methylmalate dehydratase small subunit